MMGVYQHMLTTHLSTFYFRSLRFGSAPRCASRACFLYPASSSAVTNEGVVFISCDTSLGLPLNNLALFKAMGVEMV